MGNCRHGKLDGCSVCEEIEQLHVQLAGCGVAAMSKTPRRSQAIDRERGYVDLNVTGLLIAVTVIGVIAGLILCPILSWAWGVVKPWLHAITG